MHHLHLPFGEFRRIQERAGWVVNVGVGEIVRLLVFGGCSAVVSTSAVAANIFR